MIRSFKRDKIQKCPALICQYAFSFLSKRSNAHDLNRHIVDKRELLVMVMTFEYILLLLVDKTLCVGKILVAGQHRLSFPLNLIL